MNTQSGLSSALDAVGQALAARQQNEAQLAGLAPALAATGIPVPQQQSGGLLSRAFGGLGFGGGATAPAASQPAAQAAAPAPQQTPSAGSSALTGVQGLLDKAQAAYNIPAGYLPRVAAIESKFDPSAVSPTGAKGLFGFTKGTASQYGLSDPTDVASSVDAVGRLTSDNAAALTKSLGRAPTPGELYLAPQQGAAGAAALLKNPSLPAGQVLASIGADPKNITVNGGDPSMSAGTFASKWTSRFDGAGGAPAMPSSGATPNAGSTGPLAPAAKEPMGGLTKEAIGSLIANPATRSVGLQFWQQSITGKDFGFSTTPDGTVIRTDPRTGAAVPVYQAPVKQGFKAIDGRLLATDPLSGSARDVTPQGMPQARPATADERKAYGVGPTTPFFFGPDGKPATLQGGTQVTVNNAVNPILKGMGDQFVEGAQGARDAADSIRSIQNARTQLQGGIIAGFGADQRLQLQKLGAVLGVGDPSKISNTETFLTQIKPLVLSTVKGLGAGSGISNADRDFALQAVGGSTKLEADSIGRVLDITERAARAKIDRHNGIADQMLKTQPDLAAVGPMLHIQAPPVMQQTTATGDPTAGVAEVQSPEQARALPPGSRFRTPDGREFVR